MKSFALGDPFLFSIPAFLIAILGQSWSIWLVAIMEQQLMLRDETWKG